MRDDWILSRHPFGAFAPPSERLLVQRASIRAARSDWAKRDWAKRDANERLGCMKPQLNERAARSH